MDEIVFNQEKNLGLVTLNRASALNALTLPMIIALQQQLRLWEQDSSIHAVVIQAAEGKAFCAGGDVRWLYDSGLGGDHSQLNFFKHEYRLNYFIHQFRKPYIALMDGITMGGGVGISLHGSHPVASERFTFAMPETTIGFFPDIGASYLLARCPEHFGVYLALTGNRLGVDDASALGLVKYYIPSSQFSLVLNQLLETNLAADAYQKVSDCLQHHSIPYADGPVMQLKEVINPAFKQLNIEDILNVLEQSAEPLQLEIAQSLKQKSPLSLKITLAQIQKAKTMDFAQCLQMDYCLVKHLMKGHDFYEGVRALLVDKDKKPRWQPSNLTAVSAAQVKEYFNSELALELI